VTGAGGDVQKRVAPSAGAVVEEAQTVQNDLAACGYVEAADQGRLADTGCSIARRVGSGYTGQSALHGQRLVYHGIPNKGAGRNQDCVSVSRGGDCFLKRRETTIADQQRFAARAVVDDLDPLSVSVPSASVTVQPSAVRATVAANRG
jgi:hypothetical protein